MSLIWYTILKTITIILPCYGVYYSIYERNRNKFNIIPSDNEIRLSIFQDNRSELNVTKESIKQNLINT